MQASTRWAALAAAAGIVAGTVYTVAPLVVWSLVLLTMLVVAGGCGLPRDERRRLAALLLAALAARVVVIAAMAAAGALRHADPAVGMSLSGDEVYAMTRALRTRDVAIGLPVTKYDFVIAFDQYGRTPYVTLLGILDLWFGPSPYGVRLLNSVFFIAAALLVFRVMRRVFGEAPALAGLAVVAFYPALLLWSVSALKESLYLLGGSLVLAGAILVARGRSRRERGWAAAAIAVGLFIVARMRPESLALTATGVALGLSLSEVARRPVTRVIACVVVVVAGIAVVASQRVQRPVLEALGSVARIQTGHVFTVGHAYKTLDDAFYVIPRSPASTVVELNGGEAARYVVRSAATFLFAPTPWQLASPRELAYMPDQMLWYVLLLFLPVGIVAAWRRDPLVAALVLGYVLPTAAAVALTNGNVGTLVRLRGIIIPYLAYLSAVGFVNALGRARAPAAIPAGRMAADTAGAHE